MVGKGKRTLHGFAGSITDGVAGTKKKKISGNLEGAHVRTQFLETGAAINVFILQVSEQLWRARITCPKFTQRGS